MATVPCLLNHRHVCFKDIRSYRHVWAGKRHVGMAITHFADMPVPQILDEIVEGASARADRPARTSVQVLAETVEVVLAPI